MVELIRERFLFLVVLDALVGKHGGQAVEQLLFLLHQQIGMHLRVTCDLG